MSVCVITPTVAGREMLLEDCKNSVRAQTVEVDHLVGLDESREGPQVVRNRLASQTTAEWLLPLDDDDVLDPDCVETLLEHTEGDIVYPWCRMVGRTDNWVPNKLFNAASLFKLNFIPVTALIRRDTFEMLGGYQNVPLEDWNLYQRAYLHGCRFRFVPEVLWSYRHHEGQNYQREAA